MCKLSIQIDWGTFFSLPNPKNLSPATNLVNLAIQIVIKKCQKKANRTSISAISVQVIFHETDSLFLQSNQNVTTECMNFSKNYGFVYFLIQVSSKKIGLFEKKLVSSDCIPKFVSCKASHISLKSFLW